MYTCTFLITVWEEILQQLTSFVNLFFTRVVFGLNSKCIKYEKMDCIDSAFILNCNF